MKTIPGYLLPAIVLLTLSSCAAYKENKAYEEVLTDPALYKYENFLYEYPYGVHAAEIRDSVESCNLNMWWRSACTDNDVAHYEDFIERYPDSKYTAMAHQKIADLKEAQDYSDFKISYSIESLNYFLDSYPSSVHRAEVEALLDDETDWDKIKNERNLSAYETYLAEHPKGKYTAPANARMIQIDTLQPHWNSALTKNSEKAYKSFLTKYPETVFTQVAKDSLAKYDHLAWKIADKKNSIHGYYAYLENWPDGIHALEAENRAIDLEIALIQQNSSGELPKAEGEYGNIASDYAIMEFGNDTPYELTIWVSGAVTKKKVILDPGERMEVELYKGFYTLAASVKDKSVSNYTGTDTYEGGYLYSNSFYISYEYNFDWLND